MPARRGGTPAALAILGALLLALAVVAGWHLTQGTSGVDGTALIRWLLGDTDQGGTVPITDVFFASRLPRLLAGAAVGVALGVAGTLLQSTTHNPL
ncbi:MAG: iron chelate uptake ABC transporter family permease subunit, partial [Mycetocola sp.]